MCRVLERYVLALPAYYERLTRVVTAPCTQNYLVDAIGVLGVVLTILHRLVRQIRPCIWVDGVVMQTSFIRKKLLCESALINLYSNVVAIAEIHLCFLGLLIQAIEKKIKY